MIYDSGMIFLTQYIWWPNIRGLGSLLSYLFVLQTQYVYILFVIHDHDSF